MVKPQSTVKRGLVCSARLLLVPLAIVAVVGGCQEASPTPGPSATETVTATRLALAPGQWTVFTNTELRKDYAGVELRDGSAMVCGGSTSSAQKFVQTCNRFRFDGEL